MTPETITVVDTQGQTWYGWRKDGQRPMVDLDAMRYNPNLGLRGDLPCNFVDRVGPQAVPNTIQERSPDSWFGGGYEKARDQWELEEAVRKERKLIDHLRENPL